MQPIIFSISVTQAHLGFSVCGHPHFGSNTILFGVCFSRPITGIQVKPILLFGIVSLTSRNPWTMTLCKLKKRCYGQEKEVKWKSHDDVAVCLLIKRELISESHMPTEETSQRVMLSTLHLPHTVQFLLWRNCVEGFIIKSQNCLACLISFCLNTAIFLEPFRLG